MTTETVQIRHLLPSEGKVIKRLDPVEYYRDGLYIGKDEDINNYIEVDASEAPDPEQTTE
ncbi:MAG: hypothetical protein IJ932_02645 [Ruminococcus sp.]|nr:hypothetical protein [Ruminococcus sp.]